MTELVSQNIWCKSNRAVVIKAAHCAFLWYRDDCGGLEACGKTILQQSKDEDGGEHDCQLVSTALKDASRDPIWSRCLPDVESAQGSSSDLVLMEAVFVDLPLVDQADSWSLHSAGQIEQKNWFKVLGRELSMGLGATLLVLYPVRAFIPNWIYYYILH